MYNYVFCEPMIKRIYLFLALSLFYSSAMIVVGGYNVASDAAQLWNSQRGSNDSSSGSGYYNSQRTGKTGKPHLFNGEGNGIQREGLRDDMAYTYLQYENRQRSKNRAPAVFQYMSPYAVANRLDDIDNALRLQSERMKVSKAMLKKANKGYDPQKSGESRHDAYQKVASRISRALGGSKKRDYKSAKADNNRNRSGSASSSGTNSSGSNSSVGGSSSTLYNSSGSSNSGSGNKKSTLFNSSN